MTYRRFACGQCHRDIKVSSEGTVFVGHEPRDEVAIMACPTCWHWYKQRPKFSAKRTGES